MVRKIKKKTLFFAGIVGLSILSLFGARSNQGEVLSEADLKDLIAKTPVAHADVGPSPDGSPASPDGPSGPCPSGGDCPGPGPMGFDDRGGSVV